MTRHALHIECEISCQGARCNRSEVYEDDISLDVNQVAENDGPYPDTWYSDGMIDICPECAENKGLPTVAVIRERGNRS